jgi:hypothetical protein
VVNLRYENAIIETVKNVGSHKTHVTNKKMKIKGNEIIPKIKRTIKT